MTLPSRESIDILMLHIIVVTELSNNVYIDHYFKIKIVTRPSYLCVNKRAHTLLYHKFKNFNTCISIWFVFFIILFYIIYLKHYSGIPHNTWIVPLKSTCQSHEIKEKLNTVTEQRRLGWHNNVVSWTRTWTRKRILMEKLVKSEWSLVFS